MSGRATAVVVDPRRDVDVYVEFASRHGLVIRHVILTDFHADFVAGHPELRDRVGATIHLGARAQAEYDFHPLSDDEVLEFGSVRLQILETPGHTPVGISILVFDLVNDRRAPHAVLTGDTLFVGDVGRPDLLASLGHSAETLAGMLYDSLHGKLLRLPRETLLYPGHGAGSLCGRNLSPDTVSTVGTQRAQNYALQPMSKEAFVRLVIGDQPEVPSYFAHDADLNRREHPTLDEQLALELKPLAIGAVLLAQRAGAQVVDTRDPADFAAGHLPDSLNIGLAGRFAGWAGALLSPGRPIVVVATPGREREAALRLGRVGFDRVVGYLDGGIAAAAPRLSLVQHPRRISSEELRAWLLRERVLVIDVRSESEWQEEAIPGSVNVPLQQLRARVREIPADRPVVVYCRTGERSATAASLLEGSGRSNILDLVGGITAWKASGQDGTVRHGE